MPAKATCPIKKAFSYNADTGELTRLDRRNGSGSVDVYGYLILKIKGRQYKAHRVAWYLHYGEFPCGVIDHINGNKLDNRISNLRDVSQLENNRNAQIKPNRQTQAKGVWVDRTKGLVSNFATRIEGKSFRFKTLREAVKFRQQKLTELGYGEGHYD